MIQEYLVTNTEPVAKFIRSLGFECRVHNRPEKGYREDVGSILTNIDANGHLLTVDYIESNDLDAE